METERVIQHDRHQGWNIRAGLLAAWTIAAALTVAGPGAAQERIVLATGAVDGVYHAAGKAICDALGRQSPPVACEAASGSGSADSLMRLSSGTVNFAIVQADVQFDAVAGRGLFATTGADKTLRSVLALHEEGLAVIVRRDDPARMVADLRGRPFSGGSFGTGTRETVEHLLDAAGWTVEERKKLQEVPVETQFQALCTGKVDAIAYLVGHPARNILVAAEQCPIRLVPAGSNVSAAVTKRHPYHARTVIPAGLYRGTRDAIPTIGVRATVVTSASTPDRLVQAFVKATVGQIQVIKDTVEALASLDPKQMGSAGLSAPLHPGAKKMLEQMAIPAAPAVKIPPSAREGEQPAVARSPGLDLTAPVVAGPGAAVPSATARDGAAGVKSKPVGKTGAWTLESGGIQSGTPSLEADGAFEDADKTIQLKRALKK